MTFPKSKTKKEPKKILCDCSSCLKCKKCRRLSCTGKGPIWHTFSKVISEGKAGMAYTFVHIYQTFFCALPQPCKCPVEDLKQLEHCIKLVVEGWILNAITHFTLRAKTIWSEDIDASLRKPWFQDYSLFLASINSGVLFQFRQFIDQDITKNYRHDDVLVNIGRVALACTLLLSFPLLIFPCRAVINRVWKINTVEYEEPDTKAFLFLLCAHNSGFALRR